MPLSLSAFEVELPKIALANVATEINITNANPSEKIDFYYENQYRSEMTDESGHLSIDIIFNETGQKTMSISGPSSDSSEYIISVIPGWISIAPPLLAIFIALLLRNVIPALIAGIWFGAAALNSFTPLGIFQGLLDGFQIYVVRALSNQDHAAIILFSVPVSVTPSKTISAPINLSALASI